MFQSRILLLPCWSYVISVQYVGFISVFVSCPGAVQMSKPSNPGRAGKSSREQEAHVSPGGEMLSAVLDKNSRKLSGQVCVFFVSVAKCSLSQWVGVFC